MLIRTAQDFEVEGDVAKLLKEGKPESGMYDDAGKKGISFGSFLEGHIQTKEGGEFKPTIYSDMTHLEKTAYREQLKKAKQPIPPDAFEIMLQAYKINTKGMQCDSVSKFFNSTDAKVLYPWFVMNEVHTGALAKSIWQHFVGVITKIELDSFKKIYLADTTDDLQTGRTGQTSNFRQISANVAEREINLEGYGVELNFSYNVFKTMPLNAHAVYLNKIGAQMGVDETDDFFYIMSAGDGNANTGLEADQTKESTNTGAIEKLDIIRLAAATPMPYGLDVFAGPTDFMIKVWDAMSDMTNPTAQMGQIGIPLPFGHRWDSGYFGSTTDVLLGCEKASAMGMVTNDSMNMTEQDRVIGQQVVKTVISKRMNFYNIEQDAIGALDIVHS